MLATEKNLVIVGGGFAGVKLASKAERCLPKHWEIHLLSKTNFITYSPLLAEVVGASILPGHVLAPLRQMVKRARVRMVEVTAINVTARTVHYVNNEPGQLHFDQLVIAAGVKANVGMVAGMADHAMPLKTVGDAVFIRNHIISRLEQATIHPDPEQRKHLMKIVVIGGGFSGVEVAGEIDDFLREACRYYKNIEYEDCEIVLLHSRDNLLPELPQQMGVKTRKIFQRRKIRVCLGTRVKAVMKECIILTSGEQIHCGTIICTIGTIAHEFLKTLDFPSKQGRLIVEPDMSIKGEPGIWALGDCAIVPNADNGEPSPQTAQFADRQACQLASNISAFIDGRATKPFKYKAAGVLASIGHNKAVAELYGFELYGFVGWLLWRGIYLLKVPTLARKVRLFLEWNWAMFFPPDISHLDFRTTESKFIEHEAKAARATGSSRVSETREN